MTTVINSSYCLDCKNPVPEKRESCPYCGSERRSLHVTITEEVKLHDQIGGSITSAGAKEPRQEFKRGDDYHRQSGQWNFLDRLIDRANDWYKEHIINSNGKYIKNVNERLSKHQGHGSAKYKSK